MSKKYFGPEAITKLIELIRSALDKKQDKMDEITKDEVYDMWNKLNAPAEDEEEEDENEEDEHEPEP